MDTALIAQESAGVVVRAARHSGEAGGFVDDMTAARRSLSLAGQPAGARKALPSAGIQADLPQALDDVPEAQRQAFAYVLREGVTNVIRHSKAARCTMRLGPGFVEIRDDGASRRATGRCRPETGCGGLAERLAAIVGRIAAGPVDGGGHRLRAECTS